MKRGLLLLTVLLGALAAAHAEDNYQTGKVVHVESKQSATATDYTLVIVTNGKSYIAHLATDPGQRLEWTVNSPIRFLLEGDTMYLQQKDKSELAAVLEPAATTSASGEPAAQSSPGMGMPTTFNTPSCVEIAAGGPKFTPLARACEYVLSGKYLPNYICGVTVNRFVDGSKVNVVTGEVTFIGSHDHYSNVKIGSTPIAYYHGHLDFRGYPGWGFSSQFGGQVATIFLLRTQTQFKFKRIAKSDSGPVAIYEYKYKSENNRNWEIYSNFLTRDSHTWNETIFNPGMSGTIKIGEENGDLRSIKSDLDDPNPEEGTVAYTDTLEFNYVPIDGYGNALIPSLDNMESRVIPSKMYKNQTMFHDCRVFGSTITILPGYKIQKP